MGVLHFRHLHGLELISILAMCHGNSFFSVSWPCNFVNFLQYLATSVPWQHFLFLTLMLWTYEVLNKACRVK